MILVVVILWYRVFEFFLGFKVQIIVVDMWVVGCIFGELIGNKLLMIGLFEINQFQFIVDLLGILSDQFWLGFLSFFGVKFINIKY